MTSSISNSGSIFSEYISSWQRTSQAQINTQSAEFPEFSIAKLDEQATEEEASQKPNLDYLANNGVAAASLSDKVQEGSAGSSMLGGGGGAGNGEEEEKTTTIVKKTALPDGSMLVQFITTEPDGTTRITTTRMPSADKELKESKEITKKADAAEANTSTQQSEIERPLTAADILGLARRLQIV